MLQPLIGPLLPVCGAWPTPSCHAFQASGAHCHWLQEGTGSSPAAGRWGPHPPRSPLPPAPAFCNPGGNWSHMLFIRELCKGSHVLCPEPAPVPTTHVRGSPVQPGRPPSLPELGCGGSSSLHQHPEVSALGRGIGGKRRSPGSWAGPQGFPKPLIPAQPVCRWG